MISGSSMDCDAGSSERPRYGAQYIFAVWNPKFSAWYLPLLLRKGEEEKEEQRDRGREKERERDKARGWVSGDG